MSLKVLDCVLLARPLAGFLPVGRLAIFQPSHFWPVASRHNAMKRLGFYVTFLLFLAPNFRPAALHIETFSFKVSRVLLSPACLLSQAKIGEKLGMFIVFVIFYFPSGTDLPTAMGKKKLFVCVYGTLYQIVYQNAFPRQTF